MSKAQEKRQKNETASGFDVANPPRKKRQTPKQMAEVLEAGYDSDGWEGPPTGTDPEEIEAVEEEVLSGGHEDPLFA